MYRFECMWKCDGFCSQDVCIYFFFKGKRNACTGFIWATVDSYLCDYNSWVITISICLINSKHVCYVKLQHDSIFLQNQHTRKLICGSKDVPIQAQQQRPESLMVTLTWHGCKCKVHKYHQRYILCTDTKVFEDKPLVEFMYLVFTRMPGESYCWQLRSLLLRLLRCFPSAN